MTVERGVVRRRCSTTWLLIFPAGFLLRCYTFGSRVAQLPSSVASWFHLVIPLHHCSLDPHHPPSSVYPSPSPPHIFHRLQPGLDSSSKNRVEGNLSALKRKKFKQGYVFFLWFSRSHFILFYCILFFFFILVGYQLSVSSRN